MPKQAFGPEVDSPLAGAAKRFWVEEMDESKLTILLDKGKIPVNCLFIGVKPCNKVIFSAAPPYARTNDVGLQKVQNTHTICSFIHSVASNNGVEGGYEKTRRNG